MYQLRRLYLDQIGIPDNRFTDLTVELTDTAGSPTDSIVWLRNGAGKTTMLSLLLALILPGRNDFLATRTTGRTLEDLVQGGDTSHVVAEWADPAGRPFLTGAVYEWDGRSRPRDYDTPAGRQRFRRTWWCVHPDDTVDGSHLDQLPFTRRTNGTVDRAGFAAHIRALSPQGVNATVVNDTISAWHDALAERRFDPGLFEYFLQVNTAEGGIDKLFAKITSPRAFVHYLLRFVGDSRRIQPVKGLLDDTAAEIAKRPVYAAEQAFCAESVRYLTNLGDAHAKVLDAAGQRSDVRAVAAGFKRALLEAADVADRAAVEAGELYESHDAAARDAKNLADLARRHRDEYRRLAAEFRHVTAAGLVKEIDARLETAKLGAAAWQALETLLRLRAETDRLQRRTDAVTAAAAGAGELIARVDAAQARLAGALDAAISDIDAAVEDIRGRVGEETTALTAADTERKRAQRAVADLESEQRNLEDRLSEGETRREDAESDGLVRAGEHLDAAVGRIETEESRALDELAGVEAALAGNKTRRGDAVPARNDARAEAQRTSGTARDLERELGQHLDRAAALAEHPRIRNLAQADDVDVFSEAGDLTKLLETAIADTDATMLSLRAEAADDARALHALAEVGLLPARRAVDTVIAALDSAGISATSGWRYLAETQPAGTHDDFIAAFSHAVDGVVVYGNPHDAAAAIDGVDVADLVTITPASALDPAATDGDVVHAVVGPVAAQHDPQAAAGELDRRRSAAAVRDGRLATLADSRRGDARLLDDLTNLLGALPDDGIVGLRRRAATARVAADTARQTYEDAEGLVSDLEREREALQERQLALTSSAQAYGDQARRVRELADEEQNRLAPGRARLEAIPELVEIERAAEVAAIKAHADADGRREQLRSEARGLAATRTPLVSRRAQLPREATAADVDVATAQDALDEAEQHLREQYPEAELRRAVTEAKKDVAEAATAHEQRNSPEARARADELAGTAAATDPSLRAEAESAAHEQVETLATRLGAARTEEDEAKADLARNTPTGRARHAQELPVEPEDRAHAQRLAAEANEASIAHRGVGSHHERERERAERTGGAARTRAGMLRDQERTLRSVEPAEVAVGTIAEDADTVRAAVAEIAADLDAVEAAYNSAATTRSQRVDQLRRWAGSDRFRDVAEDENGRALRQLRDLFTGDHVVERVAPRAGELAEDLADRERAIAQQLNQVETHKRNVVHRLAELVDEALSDLSRASSLSELPAEIGPWGGLRFLTVEARTRPNAEQVITRVGDLVDRMVTSGRIELDPVELLWWATDAAVTDGFRATILKPAPEQPTGRTPVEYMSKWSGGENLTASLMLFCVLAKLRAEKRTGVRAGSTGGAVPLDNPLGKANYLPFLELQRKVAAANGVQLVFWTGIGDIGAVTTFPRIAAMHKRPSATVAGRAYVRTDDGNSYTAATAVSVVNSVRDG